MFGSEKLKFQVLTAVLLTIWHFDSPTIKHSLSPEQSTLVPQNKTNIQNVQNLLADCNSYIYIHIVCGKIR
jgi:hypothetical protein